MEEGRSQILTGTRTGKIPLGWEDNSTMDLKKIGINTRNWVDSALDIDF